MEQFLQAQERPVQTIDHHTSRITLRIMSVVSLLGVKILNNPAKFTDHYHFEITFECLEQLQKGDDSG